MKAIFQKTVSMLLAVLMVISAVPVLGTVASASSSTIIGENASYVYGAQSDMVKISGYTASDYAEAMALTEASDDLKALLSSGYGTEEAPFIVRNFRQLRLVFFWMNFSDCKTSFQFTTDGKTVVLKNLWSSVVASCGKTASDYNLTSSVYVKLGNEINATVNDHDCTSLFESAILIGKQGGSYHRYLTLLTDATLNINSAGKKMCLELSGSNRNETEAFMTGINGATLNLSDNTREGSFTLTSEVRYQPQEYFEALKNFSPPFYFANFENINAEYVCVQTYGSTGTSSFLFEGTNANIRFCTLEYSRHTSSTKNGLGISIMGSALSFSGSVKLEYDVISCLSPSDKNTVGAKDLVIEKTDIPEGISVTKSTKVQINRSSVAGDLSIDFAKNADIDLTFSNFDGYIRVADNPSVAITSADVYIEHCTADSFSDSEYCTSTKINNSVFVSQSKSNIFEAEKVSVNSSVFVTSVKGAGAVKFNRLKKEEYKSVSFTHTQISNKGYGYALEFPELYGYKTAKDEFGDEYVVSYPKTDRNISFLDCTLTVRLQSASGVTYVYQNPTHLDWSQDDSDDAKRVLGLKILTQANPEGKIYYRDFTGYVRTRINQTIDKNFTSYSAWLLYNLNNEAMLTQFSDLLTYADNTLSSIYLDGNGTENHTLSYNANGGSMLYNTVCDTWNSSAEATILYGSENVTRNGYVFVGWSTDKTDTVARYQKGDTLKLTADTTLYAVYKKRVSVTYNLNGGEDSSIGRTAESFTLWQGDTIKLNRDESGKTALYTPELKGKKFLGWSTNSNSSTAEYEDGTSYTLTDDVTFYATWSSHKDTVYIEFKDANDNRYTGYTQYGDTSFTVPAGCSAPTGKRFVKWYDRTNSAYYKSGDKYVVGDKNAVLVPVFETIPDSEIMHTITEVKVTGVKTPVEEEYCVTDGALTGGTGYTAQYAGGTSTWYYINSNGYTIHLDSSSAFIGGIGYTVRVNVTPSAKNYSFSSSTVFYINGTRARVDSVSNGTYTISAQFTCSAKNLIRDVKITGFTAPLAGATPQSSLSASSSSTTWLNSTATVKWYNGSTLQTGSFVSGKKYHAEITVKSNAMAWLFSKNPSVKINGSDASVKEVRRASDGMSLVIVLQDMSVDKTAISECTITGVPEPYENSEPEKPALECATDWYTASIDTWTQFANNGTEHDVGYGSDKAFSSGLVRCYVDITPKEGYALATNPVVKINGKTATKEATGHYYIEFTAKQAEKITSLSFSGVPIPTDGQAIDFSPVITCDAPHTKVELNTYPVEIWTGSEDKTVTPIWTATDPDTYIEKVITDGTKAKTGDIYSLYVAVTHDTGYEWDDELDFNISANGGILPVDFVKDVGNTRIFRINTEGMSGVTAQSISVTGFAQPSVCSYPNILAGGIKSADSQILSKIWLNADGSVISDGFVEGEQYILRIILLPNGYDSFDANTVVNIDGAQIASAVYSDEIRQGGCITVYTVPYTATAHCFNKIMLPNEDATEASKHLARKAGCTTGAEYYYYCDCGVNGSNTVSYGDAQGHNFTVENAVSSALKSAATCTAKAEYYKSCSVCGKAGGTTFTSGDLASHSFTVQSTDAEYLKSAATCTAKAVYYKSCADCGLKSDETFSSGKANGHSFTNYVSDNNATCANDGTTTAKCNNCDVKNTITEDESQKAHSYVSKVDAEYLKSAATCTAKAVYYKSCSVCGVKGTETFTTGSTVAHSYTSKVASKYLKTAATCTAKAVYYKSCSVCGAKGTETFTSGSALGHKYDSGKVTKKATCTATGVKTYTCTVCMATKTETIAKTAHSYKTVITPATLTANGKKQSKCSVCGNVKSTTAIRKISKVTLSKTTATYTGKAIKPTVTVKDSAGNVIKSTYYTVTYKNNTNVGRATVTVKFKGNYSGSKTLTFTITPKATTVSKVTSTKKGTATVTVKKQATQTTGYEIQYSTSSKFTASTTKTVKITSAKTLSKTISKLSSGKTYYFRVRTYKIVSKVNYCSAWSTSVKAKIK